MKGVFAMGILNFLATTSGAAVDFSEIDFTPLTASVTDALPVIIPVALALMAPVVIWRLVRKFIK